LSQKSIYKKLIKMNFKNLLLTSVLMAATSVGFAQKNLKEDKQAIKDMCGCFEVTFKYTETFFSRN